MKIRISSLVALLLGAQMLSTQAAFAWSDLGHMAVAYLAYKQLTPKTKERVDALVKLNPFYEAWKAEMRDSHAKVDPDAGLYMLCATFPDLIKKDSRYTSDGSEQGNKPDAPGAAQNTGYADHLMHKYWHFYDLPFSQDKSKIPQPPAPNALTQIQVFRKTLASDALDELKSFDLCWLTHIVGDVHQPLHCTTRVSKDAPDGDDGGNDIYIKYNLSKYKYKTYEEGEKQKIRFHWFWDSCLGNTGLDNAVRVAETLSPSKKSLAKDIDENHWVKESFELAKKKLYASPIQAGNGPFEMTDKYEQSAIALSKERVMLAADRLANVLNKELK